MRHVLHSCGLEAEAVAVGGCAAGGPRLAREAAVGIELGVAGVGGCATVFGAEGYGNRGHLCRDAPQPIPVGIGYAARICWLKLVLSRAPTVWGVSVECVSAETGAAEFNWEHTF